MRQYFDVVVQGPLIFLNFWVLVPIAYGGVLEKPIEPRIILRSVNSGLFHQYYLS